MKPSKKFKQLPQQIPGEEYAIAFYDMVGQMRKAFGPSVIKAGRAVKKALS
tara:strand:- start:2582 stop:2734 length:153 start_codon:yes stop_codon:yes gene_type:complete